MCLGARTAQGSPRTRTPSGSGRPFSRPDTEIRVEVSRPADGLHRDAWVETLATASWRHDAPDVPAPGAALALPRITGDAGQLRLVVIEGDNAPLPVSGAELLLPAYRVRFYRPLGAPLMLAYGDPKLTAPEYDLALLGATVLGTAATEINAGSEQQVTPAGGARVVPPAAFWAVLVLAAFALGWLVVGLVKKTGA